MVHCLITYKVSNKRETLCYTYVIELHPCLHTCAKGSNGSCVGNGCWDPPSCEKGMPLYGSVVSAINKGHLQIICPVVLHLLHLQDVNELLFRVWLGCPFVVTICGSATPNLFVSVVLLLCCVEVSSPLLRDSWLVFIWEVNPCNVLLRSWVAL